MSTLSTTTRPQSNGRGALRIVLALVMLALLLGAGCGRRTPTNEADDASISTATATLLGDTPTTLAGVRALAEVADTEVVITQRDKRKNIACGHSPLCVLALPAIAFDAAFPDKVTSAVVTRRDSVVWRGHFDTRGRLVSAVALVGEGEDTRALRVQRLTLRALGRSLIVVTATGADPAAMQPTPVSQQAPLLPAYRERLSREQAPATRRRLALEALRAVGDDARPLVTSEMARADSAGREALLSALSLGKRPRATREAAVTAALEGTPAPRTLVAALGCMRETGAPSWPAARAVAEAVVERACTGPERDAPGLVQALLTWAGGGRPTLNPGTRLSVRSWKGARRRLSPPADAAIIAALVPKLETCAPGARRTLVALALGRALQPERVLAALSTAEPGVARGILGRLDLRRDDHAVRDSGLRTLAAGPLRQLLQAMRWPPTGQEARLMVAAFIRLGPTEADFRTRAAIVERLRRLKRRDRAAALAAAGDEGRGDDAALLAMRASLGDKAAEWLAAAALRGVLLCGPSRQRSRATKRSNPRPARPALPSAGGCVRAPFGAHAVANRTQLVAWALRRAGCSTAELQLAALGEPQAGRLCQGRKRL